jgi:hypothetical protein
MSDENRTRRVRVAMAAATGIHDGRYPSSTK